MNRSLHNNIRTLYLLGFFHNFMVVMPVFVPLVQGFGLSMSEVLQTQALFALTIALCEVPSGYLADLWGRRRVILLGAVLNALGFVSLLWADSFVDVLVYEVILGVGVSLLSGADLALLYDTEVYLQERGQPGGAGAGKSLSRLIAAEAAASGLAGVAASVLLLWWAMDAVILVQAVSSLLPVVLAYALVEVPRPAAAAQASGDLQGNARRIVELLLFGKPVVLWTACAIILFGLLAVYVFWVYPKYWEAQGIPVSWYGYIWALFALTVSVAARYTGALERWLGTRTLLAAVGLLPVFGLAGMALGSGWLGVACGFALQLSRGVSMTLFYEALNRRVPGDFRATVNSLVSLAVRAVFIVTGPLLGYALDRLGVNASLALLAAMFTPCALLVLLPLLSRIRREAADEAAQPVPAP